MEAVHVTDGSYQGARDREFERLQAHVRHGTGRDPAAFRCSLRTIAESVAFGSQP